MTLVDQRNYHLFQPLLYQVATAALSPADIAWPIRSIFAGPPNVRVVLGTVEGVDLEGREVAPGRLGFHTIISSWPPALITPISDGTSGPCWRQASSA